MRRLFATASSIVLAAAWACDASDPPPNDASDAGDASAIDAGDGTCSVEKRFDEPVLVGGLGDGEIAAAHLDDEERRIFFSRDAALYEAERSSKTDAFTNVRALASLNVSTEGSPTLSSDLLTIWFHSTRDDAGAPGHVFRSTRGAATDAFGAPVKIETLDFEVHRSTPHRARHASELWLSAADKSLAFRVYSAKLRPDGLTDAPVMARELSVSGLDAAHAVLSADGRAIYWSASSLDASAANTGDIWVATRSSGDGPFEALRPVTELNTPAFDAPAWLSSDRCRLYLVSARADRRALYVASRSP